MFLFGSIPWYSWVAWFVVLAALIILNEVTRRSRYMAWGFYIALPIVLTLFVWPTTANPDSATGTWFHWVKVYSALAGVLGFMLIRYHKKLALNKMVLIFPAAILAINILEACIRDFQVGAINANGMVDGVFMLSGPWNYMNGIAGIINLITICGWTGIVISRDSAKDMIWPDMMWFWIIAYDLWNFAYVYNCVGDHSFYAGAALLISCTIPAFFIKKGAWLEHRAQTLALWMMFTMAVPAFVTDSKYSVSSSHNPTALLTVSLISLLANIAVLIWQSYVVITTKKNPLKDELYTNTKAYQEIYIEAMGVDAAATASAEVNLPKAGVYQ